MKNSLNFDVEFPTLTRFWVIHIKSVGVKNYVFNDRNDSTPSILTLNDSQSKWYCDYSTVIFSATFFPTMWFLVFFAGLAFIVIKCSNVEKTDSKNNVDVESNMKRTRLEVICKNWWCHYLRSLDSTIRLAQTNIFYYKKKINMMMYKMSIWSCLDHNKSKFSYRMESLKFFVSFIRMMSVS